MKISQLIATKNTKSYYESVASRLPRDIKSQQQLLNFGYSVAVHDLGLSKAKTLDENFAVNLINSYHRQCLDEGIGSFLGKAAGHVAGAAGAAGRGIKGAWNDAKAGYQNAKAVWDPKDPPGTYNNAATPAPAADPAAGGAPAATPAAGAPAAGAPAAEPAAGAPAAEPAATPAPAAPAATPAPAPAADPGAIGSIMQAVDKLDPASKKQLAGELEKSIAAAPKPEAPATEPGAAPATEPGAPAATDPATQGTEYDPAKAAADKAAKNQADADQRNADIEKTKQANAAKAQQDAAIKTAADAAKAKPGFQQTAADKLAIKAAADKGIREAKEKKKKLKKKVVAEFKSNFLGMKI